MRDTVGPDNKLMVDANCAYRYYQAIQFAKRVDPMWGKIYRETLTLNASDLEGTNPSRLGIAILAKTVAAADLPRRQNC